VEKSVKIANIHFPRSRGIYEILYQCRFKQIIAISASCHSRLNPESTEHQAWIPAFAGMTKSDILFLETALTSIIPGLVGVVNVQLKISKSFDFLLQLPFGLC
jgi:hypothetical protein